MVTDTTRKHILSSISYVLGAQIIVMVIGIVRALILPAFFSVASFGYWSTYFLYTSFVGLFCIGFNDGVYLRYGEYDYGKLPFHRLRSATWLYAAQLAFFSAASFVAVWLFVSDPDVRYAMGFAALNIVVMGCMGLIIQVLQITDQLKRYSLFSIVDKVAVLITILLMFMAGYYDYKVVIAVDFVAKTLVLLVMIVYTRELWFGAGSAVRVACREYWYDMSVGIKLMIANLMSMLIVGAGRLIVQIFGNIDDFAVYSFGISMTGIVLTAVTAFSLVLYPVLKRLPRENYLAYFHKINTFTRVIGALSFLLYFAVYFFILWFYPKYTDALGFLNLLFGVVYLQSKIGILNNSFFKVLRDEKEMLRANLSCIALFVVIAVPAYYFWPEIWVIALCTFVAMMVRAYASEVYLLKRMDDKASKQMLFEILFIVLFIAVTAFTPIFVALGVTILIVGTYFIAERGNIYATAMTMLKTREG